MSIESRSTTASGIDSRQPPTRVILEHASPWGRWFARAGWIVAGVTVGSLLPRMLAADALPAALTTMLLGDPSGNDVGRTNLPFLLAAATSLVLGLYSFTLPHSPPKGRGQQVSVARMLGLDAIGLFKSPAFAVFAIASFLVCIPLAVYYAKANEYISDMARAPRPQPHGPPAAGRRRFAASET